MNSVPQGASLGDVQLAFLCQWRSSIGGGSETSEGVAKGKDFVWTGA